MKLNLKLPLAILCLSVLALPAQANHKTFHIKNCSKHHLSIDIALVKFGAKPTVAFGPGAYKSMHCAHHKCNLNVNWDGGLGGRMYRGNRIFEHREAGHYIFDVYSERIKSDESITHYAFVRLVDGAELAEPDAMCEYLEPEHYHGIHYK